MNPVQKKKKNLLKKEERIQNNIFPINGCIQPLITLVDGINQCR